MPVPYITAEEIRRTSTPALAAGALESYLQGPEGEPDPARVNMGLPGGEMLVMPSRVAGLPSVKVVTVAHHVSDASARIQGVHLMFDRETLAPLAILDAPELTLLRTAAVSLVALRRLAAPNASELLVIGAGPQGMRHAMAILAEFPIQRVQIATRRPEQGWHAAGRLTAATGVKATFAPSADLAARDADIIVCATSSSVPVYHQPDLRPGVCVVAIGTHTATTRELPTATVADAFLVVEDKETARRECGNIVIPQVTQEIRHDPITGDLRELVQDRLEVPKGTRVFTSVGMAWEDAVVGDHVLRLRQADTTLVADGVGA